MTQMGARSESGGFDPLRLHSMNDQCWAVISRETGAIALDRNNKLVMRLTESEARRLAREMSEAASAAGGPDEAT